MDKLTFRRRPSVAMVVVDRIPPSRTMSFHTLGHILAAVAEAGVVPDIVMVEAASARRPDLADDYRKGFDWAEAVGLPC